MTVLTAAAAAAAGLVSCFAGERLFRIFALLAGAVAGFDAGLLLMARAGFEGWPVIAAAAACSLAGALLSLAVLRLSVATAALAAGWIVSRGLGAAPAVCLFAAVASGVLGAVLSRHIIAVLTAATGAAAASWGIFELCAMHGLEAPSPLPLALAAVLFLSGAAVQLGRAGRRRGRGG